MDNNIRNILILLKRQPVDFSKLDCQELLVASRVHRVVSHIYRSLLTYPSVPSEFILPFKNENRNNQCNALLQMQIQIELTQLFQQHQIPVIFLKGLLLSKTLYGDIGVRQSRDIDLLVPEACIVQADKILREHGYLYSYSYPIQSHYLKQIQFTFKDLEYFHPNHKISIELHWRVDSPYTFNPGFDRFWENRQTVPFMNQNFYTLSVEDEWLYLCTHGSRHAWKRLHWLYDIAQYNQLFSMVEKKHLAEKILRYGIDKHYNLAVYFMDKYFSSNELVSSYSKKIPSLYLQKVVLQQMAKHQPELDIKTRIVLFLYAILLATGIKTRLYHLLNSARLRYLLYWTKYRLPPFFFFLCYPIFLFSLVGKLIQKAVLFINKPKTVNYDSLPK